MTLNSQEREDGNYPCKTCDKVFSSVKALSSHQRVHKTGNSSPPPKNPYDHEAFVFPGEESEEEEGEIRSNNDRRRQGTLKCANAETMELKQHKEEDFSPDELEVAESLQLALDSNCPPMPVTQENHKMEEKVNQEDDCLGTPITKKVKITGHKMKNDGSIVYEWPSCPKGLRALRRSGRKAAAVVAEGGRLASAQVFIKEYKCEICGAKVDSGQALGGHMRKHFIAKKKVVANVNDHQPEKNLIVVDDDKGVEIDLNNIPVQVPEDMTMVVDDDGAAAKDVKKEEAEDVIMEDIHEGNDDCKRSRLTFDLKPINMMKGIDLNLEPVDIDED